MAIVKPRREAGQRSKLPIPIAELCWTLPRSACRRDRSCERPAYASSTTTRRHVDEHLKRQREAVVARIAHARASSANYRQRSPGMCGHGVILVVDVGRDAAERRAKQAIEDVGIEQVRRRHSRDADRRQPVVPNLLRSTRLAHDRPNPDGGGEHVSLRASVVIATYNRGPSVERLVRQLAAQNVGDIEVIVVDDGSREDPTARLRVLDVPFPLVVERQENAGAAAARHRGALLARAPVVIFLDDDMQIDATFIAAHLDIHEREARAVVLGRIKPDIEMRQELVERFHADVLDRFASDVVAGRRSVRGPNVYTGNLSVKRDAYMRTGGFDATLGHSEDAELGVRLEKDGAAFHLSDEAATIHSSDRGNLSPVGASGARRSTASSTHASRRSIRTRSTRTPWRYLHGAGTCWHDSWLVLSVLRAGGRRAARRDRHRLLRRGARSPGSRARRPSCGHTRFRRGVRPWPPRQQAGTTIASLAGPIGSAMSTHVVTTRRWRVRPERRARYGGQSSPTTTPCADTPPSTVARSGACPAMRWCGLAFN